MNEDNITSLQSRIREYINNPRKQNALLQDLAYWNMLCSCLDALGDTEYAIEAYQEALEPENHGALYLLIYGTLQALFIQQDAVRNLSEALNLEYEADETLIEIRKIRNDAVGHPTKRGVGKGRSYNFISRMTMKKSGFQLMTTYPDDTPIKFQEVNIQKIIQHQQDRIKDILKIILVRLEEEEMAHIEKHKDYLLRDVFPPSLRYHISKLFEASYGSAPAPLGKINLQVIEKVISDFKERLAERGELGAYVGVENTLELLDYPMNELRIFFCEEGPSKLNEKDAYIFISFVSSQFDELKEMADEIDAKYEQAT